MSKQPQLPPYDHKPKPYAGPSFEETMKLRKQYLSPGLFLYYKNPIMIVEGSMQYLYDQTGRRFLDAVPHDVRVLPVYGFAEERGIRSGSY